MSVNRFEELIDSLEKNGYDERHVILVNEWLDFTDGQHRCCYLAYKYGLDHEINVVKYFYLTKRNIVKSLIPKFIRRMIHEKNHPLQKGE